MAIGLTNVISVMSILSMCIFSQQPGIKALRMAESQNGSKQKLVCYFTSWAEQRPGKGQFLPENINPKICTHINYAFAVLSNETLTMIPSTPYIDVTEKFYERVIKLKKENKKLKVLLSLGGWSDSKGDKYSRMVSDPRNRKKFVSEAVKFLKIYEFDGLDLDWEYPVCWQADCSNPEPSDRMNFVLLVEELREAFDQMPTPLLLTAAVTGSRYFAEQAYDIAALAEYLDFFNVMSFNIHGQWEQVTGHGSEMYSHSTNKVGDHSVVSIMEYLVQEGSPPEKLILGIPLFGRSFTLQNSSNNGIDAPTVGPGKQGSYTKENGLLAYFEICDLIKNDNWTVQRDPKAGPYAFQGDQWVGYDDEISAKAKALLVLEKGYGGVMVWDLSFDDFRGECDMNIFPIVTTLKMNLQLNDSADINDTANGSSSIPVVCKSLILWTALFVLFQEQKNACVLFS